MTWKDNNLASTNYTTIDSELGYPIIVRQILDDSGTVLSSMAASFTEAELSGYDMSAYFLELKEYIQTYAAELESYETESDLDAMDKHMSILAALRYFTNYLEPKWAEQLAVRSTSGS